MPDGPRINDTPSLSHPERHAMSSGFSVAAAASAVEKRERERERSSS